MQSIVCATRGGKACHRTQGHAIGLAQERDAELIFLFIVDPGFAEPLEEKLRTALIDELARLGRSVLYAAQERAREQGLTAQAVVRHGTVPENIEEYVRQVNASTLVIGSPDTGPKTQAFTTEGLNNFADSIREATSVEVVIVA